MCIVFCFCFPVHSLGQLNIEFLPHCIAHSVCIMSQSLGKNYTAKSKHAMQSTKSKYNHMYEA